MSYRAFKRLLGETSLERKCRFLFGGFILLLITSSFYLYARQTEGLAYEQMDNMCRLLIPSIVMRQHTAKVNDQGDKNPNAPGLPRTQRWPGIECLFGPQRRIGLALPED